jgi:hypothetical protein
MTTTRWTLVPVGPIDRPAFCDRGESRQCCWDNSVVKCCSADIEQARRDAEPGAALLAEVLAARDALNLIVDDENTSAFDILQPTYALLAALDKLGPAAEGET